MRTMSELSLSRSKVICVPSGVRSNVRVERLFTEDSRRAFFDGKSSSQKYSDDTWSGVGM